MMSDTIGIWSSQKSYVYQHLHRIGALEGNRIPAIFGKESKQPSTKEEEVK